MGLPQENSVFGRTDYLAWENEQADVKLEVVAADSVFYPDVFVTCKSLSTRSLRTSISAQRKIRHRCPEFFPIKRRVHRIGQPFQISFTPCRKINWRAFAQAGPGQ